MSGSGGNVKIFCGKDGSNIGSDLRQCNKSCILLKEIEEQGVFHKPGTIFLAEKEDDKHLYVCTGHGSWRTLIKGVDALEV